MNRSTINGLWVNTKDRSSCNAYTACSPDAPPDPNPNPNPNPDLVVSVLKTSDPANGTSVAAGDTISYTVTATVTGEALTSDLVLTDTLGAGQTFGSVTEPGAYTADTGGSPVLTFTLPSGTAPGTYAVTYTVTVDVSADATVSNSVAITGNGGDPDPSCTGCSTDHPMSVPAGSPVVNVLKTSDPEGGRVDQDSTITYTVTATVTGNPLTSDLVLTDTLGIGLTFGSVTVPGDYTADTSAAPVLTFTLPSGTAPGTYAVTYTAVVNNTPGTTVDNSVEITGDGGDADPTCEVCSIEHSTPGV